MRRRRSTHCALNCAAVAALVFLLADSRSPAADEVVLRGPFGIGVRADGSFYVGEIQGKRVSKFDAEGNSAGAITAVSGYGELRGPFDVDVTPSGNILICDTLGHAVLLLDANEQLILKLGSGEATAERGEFHEPHFAVVHEGLGRIYVADTHNHRIEIFDMDGKLLHVMGTAGKQAPGRYVFSNGVAVDAAGSVYAMNWTGAYINFYNPEWQIVSRHGRRGMRPGEWNDAYSIVIRNDSIWVADTYNNRLQQLSMDWQPLNVIGGEETSDIHGFSHPTDLDFDAKGNIYVADWKNDRVLKLDANGHFLRKWGSRAVDMTFVPPEVLPRRPGLGPLQIGSYSAINKITIDKTAEANADWIYYSCNGQTGDWAINPAEVAYAHEKGVEAGVSIAIFPMGAEHPKWRDAKQFFMWKKGGTEPTTRALSYFFPEVRRWKAIHCAGQIKRLKLDGIFLDYIRYPNALYGYEPAMVAAFREETGKDAHAISPYDHEWLKFRAKFVTLFIAELRYELAQLDWPVQVSVFINPDPGKNLRSSLQEWDVWTKMGIVDKIHIGVYTRDIPSIYESVVTARQFIPDKAKISMMLCTWGGNLNTPEMLKKGAEAAMAGGPDEMTVYRGDSIFQLGMWPAIGEIARKYKSAE